MSAHPDDILVVCWAEEARLYPQFKNRQVIPVTNRAKLEGRRFRKAWVTGPALRAVNARFWDILHREAYFLDAEIKYMDEYKDGE